MGAFKSCSRIVLVLINILFSLIGLTLLVVGCIVRWGTEVMNQYLSDIYKELQKTLEDATGTGLPTTDIADMIGDLTLSVIVLGTFFFVIGVLGCIGALCTVRFMLKLYVGILVVLLLAEVVFVVVLFAVPSMVDDWLKQLFKDTLYYYKDDSGKTNAISKGLNFIMQRYNCCGVEGYGDFNKTSWNRTFIGSNDEVEQKVIPAVCCKNVSDTDCWQNPTKSNSYMDQGCYDAIKDWLNANLAPVIGTGVGILVVEITLVIFACVACSKERNNDKDEGCRPAEIPRGSYDGAYDNKGYRERPDYQQPYVPYNGYEDRVGPRDPRGGQRRQDRKY